MPLLEIDRLTYRYPEAAFPALRELTLGADGGLHLITGASGSGKSTLLRVCNGLVPHFHGGRISGKAVVAGHDILRTPTRGLATAVGFLFQDPELQSVYPTVERDVAFGLENLGMPAALMHERVDEALGRSGIAALRHRAVHTLSGGERQRCALAGVLALRPPLLVLDEPLSQLDAGGAAALVETLRNLRDSGTTVLVAEHRVAMLQPLFDRRIHIQDGRLAPPPAEQPAPPLKPLLLTRSAAPAWELRSVAAGHDRRAVVGGVSLAGCPGEVVVLTGPNGAGKTTLLRTIAGLLAPLAGTATRAPGRVAYLPQNPASLLHRPTLAAEVAWTLRHDGGGDPTELLAELGIGHLAGRYPRDLSTGEQQRAALAAVLAGTPRIALLDEPTRGMDGPARAALGTVVRRLAGQGCAVVLATHDSELAASLASRCVRVEAGRAVEQNLAVPA